MAGEKGHTPEEVAEILKKAEDKKRAVLEKGVDLTQKEVAIKNIQNSGSDALEEAKKTLEQALEE